MAKLTETEMLRHVENCEKDACKLYNCKPSDLITTAMPKDRIMIRLRDAAQKERRE